MQTEPKDPRNKQPEEGTNQDMNLTNNDATLINNSNRQPDAASFNDQADSNAVNDNLTQSAMKGDEINPEYGDAADPTFETL